MAPGFTPECFTAAPAEPLIARWPAREADIRRLAVDEASERTFVMPP
jgi:hypothetical protein